MDKTDFETLKKWKNTEEIERSWSMEKRLMVKAIYLSTQPVAEFIQGLRDLQKKDTMTREFYLDAISRLIFSLEMMALDTTDQVINFNRLLDERAKEFDKTLTEAYHDKHK